MSLATFEMSMEDVRQAEPSSHAGPSTPPPASIPSPGASRPPLRNQIVEDDQFTRQALEGMLNSMAQSPLLYGLPAMRLEIHAASSGETGWQTLTGMPIDIAFIDLGLPGITGFDLSWFYLSKDAAPGASRPHDTAMIACSSADVTPEKLHEAGMHDFLKKPVTMPALRHIIHKWLPTPSDLPQVQLPPSPWTDAFGRYPNRAPGKPRFVSALVYLNPSWEAEWGAPTRCLDCGSGDVLEVPVAPGRVVLLDMDVSHSVTAPTAAAGERARYSLVCKLVLHPSGGEAAIADPKWGAPVRFGSAVLPS